LVRSSTGGIAGEAVVACVLATLGAAATANHPDSTNNSTKRNKLIDERRRHFGLMIASEGDSSTA
jgi:hypothetical protein